MLFRKKDDDESDDGIDDSDDDDDDLQVVSKIFLPATSQAVLLMSDGAEVIADKLQHGPNGFIEAIWLQPPERLQLEIANLFLVDGKVQTDIIKPAGQQQRKKVDRKQTMTGTFLKKGSNKTKKGKKCKQAKGCKQGKGGGQW